MSDLPENWTSTQLGEVCKVVRGITFPASAKEEKLTPDNVCCLRTTNVQKEVDWDDVYFVSKEYVKRDDQFVKIGDILMSMANSYELVGKVSVVRELPYITSFGAFISAVRPLPVIEAQYLFHLLRTAKVQSELRKGSSQTVNIANISVSRLSEIEIPLPPLPEQKRIADKLDALLARADSCERHLERVPQILKRFRQSVLAAATSGRLTEGWREEKGIEYNWQKVKFSDVGTIGRGKSKHRPRGDKRLYGGNYPFIQTGDIAQSNGWITSHSQTYSEFGLKQSKLWGANTVCITIAANIANTAILSYPACFPDSVVGFVADPEKSLPQFVKWSIDVIKNDLESFAPATAQKNINLGILEEVQFDCPSLEEQTEIVRCVEKLLAYAEHLEARYLSASERVGRLTPSLLAKAFRGELVGQDPNDESASILLERIREAREAGKTNATGKKPSRKKDRTAKAQSQR